MNELLEIAINAAVSAGAEIMNIYSKDFEISFKSDHSPLTVADERANAIINSILIPTKIPIISEENKQINFEDRKSFESCWMIDPLDGTKEFIKRNGEFTVNIALIKNMRPVLGVIYVPVTKTLYYAVVQDNKAYKIDLSSHFFANKMKGQSQLLVPSLSRENEVIIVASRSHLNSETELYIDDLTQLGKKVSLVSRGSSLKFCLLADGKANIYPRFAPTMEWDTAAGHAICNAVGLKVMQIDLEEELKYNKESLLNPFFVVK
ncbi:3'(2'),5'-bisphosphate nucleotidase CysQ [Flavobacterium sp. 5]|uniref:3'(2'),5'-bisphosphate nucleotidase CysQ n=1 Tax=Flavobacterium sp. 5 TaxID=2035199 RepID=UPI000C2C4716|nr:3'(2'),5'-bisphosphate nucleotidase CysQ [Flavobacterium sp. 5]PKB17444.1 3'(2'),5'-bisphosphate nucleotidase [Flavobacterium sp. 5]